EIRLHHSALFAQTVFLNAPDHSHDGHDRLFRAFPPGNPDALAERILVSPITLRKFFIDDDRVESGSPIITERIAFQMLAVVLFSDVTSLEKRNSHRPEVLGRNKMNLQRRLQMRRWLGSSFNEEAHIPTAFIQRNL